MSRFRLLVIGYLIALAASWAWQALDSAPPPLPAGMASVSVPVDAETDGAARSVRLAFRESGPDRPEALLLLHGSPGSLQDFDALARRLGETRRVLVPDLLGFGASERDVPDHSFVAQAEALRSLLVARGIERVDVVAFSWGGGVALELAARVPERVASVVLVSALGVQELELLGRYELNRLVHAFQHAIVVALDWGVPHFGRFSRSVFGPGYTRSFLDADQRPLRGILEQLELPLLVVHGRDDFLVPATAAEEHHRLVPHSEAVWIEGGHLVLATAPDVLAAALRDWLGRSEAGALARRASASPERVQAAAQPFDRAMAGPQNGLGWVVFFVLVFLASLVSEDLTCAGVGLLAATGQVGFLGGVLACVFALVLGDLVLYVSGRALGPPILRRFGRAPDEVGPIGERLREAGGLVVLIGRFVPGARLPTYVAAGAVGYPVIRFVFWLTLAAALWAPLLVGLTMLGGRFLEMQSASSTTVLRSGLVLVLAIALFARIGPQLVSWRGRRLLLSKWRRLRRWEFWPIWAIYAPLVPALVGMMIRARSVRGPTLVNPPIPGGGLAGESKAEIGALLDRQPDFAIPTLVLEPDEIAARQARIQAFVEAQGITGRFVLKPDVGERGRGVCLVETPEEIEAALSDQPTRLLVQTFVPGDEFGLFYWRAPDEETGTLYSVARKSPRSVVGNGKDTLERLILLDPICLPMAPRLLEINADRLETIPSAGERVRVTELGTHSLGCRFLVGEDLRSAALEAAVDRLSQGMQLDFGRYDVRAADEAALSRGAFRVIEFNGLTGEAAHMYDPRYGLGAGLAVLREQWQKAFEIGGAHRAAGRAPLSWRALFRLVVDSRD